MRSQGVKVETTRMSVHGHQRKQRMLLQAVDNKRCINSWEVRVEGLFASVN
jgi:hypothetical protein